MKFELVPNWRKWHTWHCMRGMTAGTILTATAGSAALAGSATQWLTVTRLGVVLLLAAAIFVASMAGRLLMQDDKTDGK